MNTGCGCFKLLADKMRDVYNKRGTDNPAQRRSVTTIVLSATSQDGSVMLPAEVDFESARGSYHPGVLYYDAKFCPLCGAELQKGGAK